MTGICFNLSILQEKPWKASQLSANYITFSRHLFVFVGVIFSVFVSGLEISPQQVVKPGGSDSLGLRNRCLLTPGVMDTDVVVVVIFVVLLSLLLHFVSPGENPRPGLVSK